jgi:hypothetical protein
VHDQAVVSWQLGRPARAFRRVARRCVHGYPAVTEQAARTEDGEPFPTSFWLTCPWLDAAVARLEAAGGVERWSRAAATDPELATSLARADALQRSLRPEVDGGIAGRRDGGPLKCLHAHVAFALARPGYRLGELILTEAEGRQGRWCPDVRCRAAEGGEEAGG